jgi:hypothetical protein
MIRDLLLPAWDPFREMMPFYSQPALTFSPTFEIKETPTAYVFKADVSGIKDSDLQVSLTENRLSISGKRREERKDEKDTFDTYERSSRQLHAHLHAAAGHRHEGDRCRPQGRRAHDHRPEDSRVAAQEHPDPGEEVSCARAQRLRGVPRNGRCTDRET